MNADDVSFSNTAGQDLVITLSNGETVTILYHFSGIHYDMSYIEFADGTTLDTQDIRDKVLTGGSGDDVIQGWNTNDTLIGGNGNDHLDGGNGDDNHYGGAGNDIILGNVGADLFDGGDGIDTIDFIYSSDNFTIDLSQSHVVFSDGFVEQIVNFENIIGGSGNNTLTGDTGDNTIEGRNGNDTLTGGNGNDHLDGGNGDDNHYGGAGNDIILGNVGADLFDGGDGIDTIDFIYSSDNFTIDLSQSHVVFSDGFVEQVVNFENVIGGSGNNSLTGDTGDNTIEGRNGNDTLAGDLGNDTFVFATGDGVDHITDYTAASDLIRFVGLQFADLSITQAGSDVQIDYGAGDQVIVDNAAVADFVEQEFQFA